jgi:hypothetical protein
MFTANNPIQTQASTANGSQCQTIRAKRHKSSFLRGNWVAYVAERDAMIRVYDVAGNVIETHEHKSDFWEP